MSHGTGGCVVGREEGEGLMDRVVAVGFGGGLGLGLGLGGGVSWVMVKGDLVGLWFFLAWSGLEVDG